MAIEETVSAPTDSAALNGAGVERPPTIAVEGDRYLWQSLLIGLHAPPVLSAVTDVAQANTQVEHLNAHLLAVVSIPLLMDASVDVVFGEMRPWSTMNEACYGVSAQLIELCLVLCISFGMNLPTITIKIYLGLYQILSWPCRFD
jgi:hypothetical protein